MDPEVSLRMRLCLVVEIEGSCGEAIRCKSGIPGW